ncbi:MAG: cytochrome c biogenesis protein ResB, partial [Candidatus Krumholzibacteria bacterium]
MNQTRNKNPIIRALGSAKLTLVILAAFAVSIAVATFLEVRYGAAGARALVYNARWFEALLALLVLNVIVALVANLPYRKHQTGYVITHIAFIIVLLGAGITRFFAYEGSMAIREGASTDYIYSTADYVSLQAGTESASFPVRLYKPDRNVLQRDVTVGRERFRVSIDEYWPHMDERLAEGPGGRPVVVFAAQAHSGGHSGHRVLDLGDAFRASGVTVHFVGEEVETVEAGTARGEMVVVIDEETHRMAVPAGVPAGMKAAGYRFRITEFAPDFRVGRTPDPADAMNNPAIRVMIEGPNGTSAERLLFAF